MSGEPSSELNAIILKGRELAVRYGQSYLDLEHYLLGIIHAKPNRAREILLEMGCDLDTLDQLIVNNLVPTEPREDGNIILTRQAEEILKSMYLDALNIDERALQQKMRNNELKDKVAGSEHLLLGILRMDRNSIVLDLKVKWGIDYERVKGMV